jgi:hypothetical protein
VAIFIDANQNDRQCYRPQRHVDHLESKTGFNIDGRIDGSLKTFLDNTGLYNALKTISMDLRTYPQQGNLAQKS